MFSASERTISDKCHTAGYLPLTAQAHALLAQAENRTLEYDTSLKKLEDISDYAKRVAFLEKNAVRLRETAAYGRCISNEYTRKITIT